MAWVVEHVIYYGHNHRRQPREVIRVHHDHHNNNHRGRLLRKMMHLDQKAHPRQNQFPMRGLLQQSSLVTRGVALIAKGEDSVAVKAGTVSVKRSEARWRT